MRFVDTNILLYAINRDSPLHKRAKTWLEDALSGEETIALPWVVILGFLRVATNPHILPRPLRSDEALAVADGWLGRPQVIALVPGDEHWTILRGLLAESGAGGNLTTDAHVAALAIESGSTLCSTDADFARFRHVRWVNPLAV